MVDSIRETSNYVNRIHSHRASGKLHKGHNIAAATASIPSKYQTVVTNNQEHKGFLSKSKRFSHEMISNENPGPGTYIRDGEYSNSSPSMSKKGTGGFASKDHRIAKHQSTCSPGSAAYALPSMLAARSDFNQSGTSSAFRSPIAQKTESSKEMKPAPNMYNVNSNPVAKTNHVSAAAAFKSRTQRDPFDVKTSSKNPGPGQYDVKDDLLKSSIQIPVSCFKSTTERKLAPDPPQIPGPGAYRPYELIEPPNRLAFPKKHYLCISAPAMALPEGPMPPGPGSYDVVDYKGPEKHYMSSSMFVSTGSRWMGQEQNVDQPGPAHYRPHPMSKQSFIYNAAGKWI